MSAYVISVTYSILDDTKAQKYSELARPAAEAFGAKYLVRTTDFTVKESRGSVPARVVVLEFPDQQAAQGWYNSEEYAPAKHLALEAFDRQVLFADSF